MTTLTIISDHTTRKISDDDICSACMHCGYHPGDQSECELNWPTKVNEDGYITTCEKFASNFSDAE